MVLLTEISQQSSSSSSSTYSYDVFLSFRGTDTRYNFTDHLHNALLDANIQTFLDDAEIQTGEELKPELEGAIKSSRASIIVLSKNYASSTWCLDELVLILEQHKNFNQIVIPVFYHVEPTHVRKQQSTFGDAMTKHRQRMDAETNAYKKSQWARKIEKWVEALTAVSDLKGKEANGWRETILIEGIIKEISRRLDLPKQSELPKIIGMKSSIQSITSFLKDGSSTNVEILTIYGMAGIGKTYLAEYMFQLHYRDFERSCFLPDIERRCASPNGLLDLQKQLLKDIHYRSWMDIQNTHVGTSKIAESLQRKSTLLVLDDVSKVEQLDVFIGTKGLHTRSKIIITSKNGSLTENWLFQRQAPLKHTKHALEGLYEHESLELLRCYAFGRIDPEECIKEEQKKVVRYCQGHPLALKVLGSSLRNEDTTWEGILESLGGKINPDIKKVLQISIDSLQCEEDKELFKYIACFFVGKDRYFTEEILKACGICKSYSIKKLNDRCLLSLRGNYIYMHKLLQDIGRDMVYQESPKKPWNRTLLWHHEDCFVVLQKGKEASKIKGLVLDMKSFEVGTSCGSSTANKRNSGDEVYNLFRSSTMLFHKIYLSFSVIWWLLGWVYRLCSSFQHKKSGFETRVFGKMCNLRILRLNYVQLNGSYKSFPKDLRWLCMHGFPLCYIPSDLTMEKMVALDMTNSNLKQLWKKPKLLESLKFVNLSCCRELISVGSFRWLPSLERLILAGCTSLVEVCESIGNNCDRLEVLDLSECHKLKNLPRSLEKLKKLKELSLDGCSNLGQFADSLQMLDANGIKINSKDAIPRIYKSFVDWLPSSLVRLSLNNNNLSNTSFPKNFQGLPMLKRLYLDENPIDSLPDFVRSLSRLELLSLSGCSRLTTVLCVPSTIKTLYTSDCDSLKRITFSPETSTPPYFINTSRSNSLTEIQGTFKVEDIAEIGEDILRSLGWIDIKHVKDSQHRMTYTHYTNCRRTYYDRETRKVLVIYEKGVFLTYFQGKEIPHWITHRSKGSSLSITIQSCPDNYRIRGLNMCLLSIASIRLHFTWLVIKNLTKNCFWKYRAGMKGVPQAGEKGRIMLSHWIFGNNEFEDGDEVSFYCHDFYIKEFGISFVYDETNKKEDPLASYKSQPWKRIASLDLSKFHTTKAYFTQLNKWRLRKCETFPADEDLCSFIFSIVLQKKDRK